jgi:ABC-type glycerol-3-phosphate transport system substrate-binding protein
MTRRRFLGKAAAAAAGLGVLGLGAQCGATPTPEVVIKEVEKVVKETVEVVTEVEKEVEVTKVVEKVVEVAPKGPKVVNIMHSSWCLQEIPMDRMAAIYNDLHRGEVEIRLSATVSGWDTKVLKMQEDKNLIFNGGLISGIPRWGLASQVANGMIAPWEDFIAASKEEGADRIKKPDMIPLCYDSQIWLGHNWGIPYSYENITYNWRTDYFAEVGYDDAPKTWAEKKEVAVLLDEKFRPEGIVPFSWVGGGHTDIMAEYMSSVKEPFTDIEGKEYTMNGRVNWRSPEMIAAWEYMRSFIDEDLTLPHGMDDWWPMYQKGKLAAVQAQSSRGVWGQKIHGQARVMTSLVPEKEVGSGCGTIYWNNSPTLFRLAPYPQEHVDFHIYDVGPANEDMQKAIIESGKTPVYEWCYGDLIEKDAAFVTYMWMLAMRKQAETTYLLWPDTYWDIDYKYHGKWRVKYLEKGSTMTAEELVGLIQDEATAEIETMTFRVDRVDGIIGGLKWTYW